MKRYIKNTILTAICIVAAAIMWDQSHIRIETKQTEVSSGSEAEAEKIIFPETYTKKINNTFSIDARVIIPEDFDSSQLYCATAKINEIDKEKWQNYFCGGKMENIVYEEEPYAGATREGDGILMETYQKDDGSVVYFSSQEATYYLNQTYDVEKCLEYDYWNSYYNKTEALFSKIAELGTISKTEAWKGLLKEVEKLGIRAEGYEIKDFYALDWQTLQNVEQMMFANGDLEQAELKGTWGGDDEVYYYCLLQKEQGLPVFYPGKIGYYMDDIWSGAIRGYFGSCGLINLTVNYIFDLNYGREKIVLTSFENIVDTLVKKYEKVITDEERIITEFKLFLYPKYIDEGIYEVIPVWICKMTYKGLQNVEYVPIHAVTAKEVLEME